MSVGWVSDVPSLPCYPQVMNGMMFSIETLAGCVTLDLTTNIVSGQI